GRSSLAENQQCPSGEVHAQSSSGGVDQRMRYPDTRQTPSGSSIGVIVSTADDFFSNTVSYWITTYLPSGAPGSFSLYWRDESFRETTLPSGGRTPASNCVHCSFVTAPLKSLAACSHVAAPSPASLSFNQDSAAVWARSSGLSAAPTDAANPATTTLAHTRNRPMPPPDVSNPTAPRRSRRSG